MFKFYFHYKVKYRQREKKDVTEIIKYKCHSTFFYKYTLKRVKVL